jgi:hypothetical protein
MACADLWTTAGAAAPFDDQVSTVDGPHSGLLLSQTLALAEGCHSVASTAALQMFRKLS